MRKIVFCLVGVVVLSVTTLSTTLGVVTSPATSTAVVGSPVIGAVGDMACDASDPQFNGGAGTSTNCGERRTSDTMLADTSLSQVVSLGDYQYECGDLADYQASYNPTWGRLDALMHPIPGNHEYQTAVDVHGDTCPTTNSTAQNYFAHFGAAAHPETNGHYSFDLGTWHLVALNANCTRVGVGGCSATDAQTTWLKNDLAATSQPCILAYWHQPLFTGLANNLTGYRPWWNVLAAAHADVVLNGHIHNYQRYPPLTPTGVRDAAKGITEYIVGTGGEKQVAVKAGVVPYPVAQAKTFGYLRMTLEPTSWTAKFVDYTGAIRDTSTGTCHP
jgi:hypothetical protein